MPTASLAQPAQTIADRVSLAKLIGEELQSPGLYGAPIRIRKLDVQGRSVTGEFVGTEDGRSYSFTFTNGKVTYQPAVKLDSGESINQYVVRWDSHTEALEANVSNPVRLDATGKRLKCGTATYQCGGICQGVHRSCHKNEKAAIDHDRLNKINALIDHLNSGGEHPSKALDKPDAAKLQATAAQIQETRDLRAANTIAKRTGDRMAKAKAAEAHLKEKYPELHGQIQSAIQGYEQQDKKAKQLLEDLKSGINSVDRAARDIQAENAEQIGNPALLADMRQKAAVEANRQILEESLKQTGRPATMTIGATVPSTKPPKLIKGGKQVESSPLFEAKLKKGDLEGAIAQSAHEADQAKKMAQTGRKRLEWARQQIQQTGQKAIADHPLLGSETKAVTPEVLPPEKPRKMRSRAEKEADYNKIKTNLEEAARGVASTAILQHAAYQTALGADVSPESIRQAQQAAGDIAVAKLRAGNQQKALPGSGGKRMGTKAAIASAQNSIKEAAESTAKAAIAHQEFMGTAMQMAKEGDQQANNAPQSGRAKRIAGLVDQLKTNQQANLKNAAQIHAVANAALQRLEPSLTPQLPTPTASTYQKPTGTPKQRMQKLVGDLKANAEEDNRNAAMTYAVAQTAVNKLAEKEQGQSAQAPKQLTGAEGKGVGTDKPQLAPKTTVPSHHYESTILGLKANHKVQKERLAILKEKKKEASKRISGGASAIQLEIIQVEDKMKELSRGIKEHEAKLKELRSRSKPIESAPLAPKEKPRTAGTGTYKHITIDSISGAIAKYHDLIDPDTAIALLKRADSCECDECQHKDEQSKYDRLVKSLAAKGADDPKALAAAIGRKKLGKKEFQRRAKAGARKAARS